MQTTLPRIITHLFTTNDLPAEEVARLKSRMSESCRAQGRAFVDLIVDRGPPKPDPADHESLRRIATGEADELMIMQIPITLSPKDSPDALLSHLDRPVQFFDTAELAGRGLLLRGSTPNRTLADAADLARALRTDGWTLRAIASRLNAERFQSARDGHWHPSTVAKLVARTARELRLAAAEESPSPPQ
jgi:hypothetical protein